MARPWIAGRGREPTPLRRPHSGNLNRAELLARVRLGQHRHLPGRIGAKVNDQLVAAEALGKLQVAVEVVEKDRPVGVNELTAIFPIAPDRLDAVTAVDEDELGPKAAIDHPEGGERVAG